MMLALWTAKQLTMCIKGNGSSQYITCILSLLVNTIKKYLNSCQSCPVLCNSILNRSHKNWKCNKRKCENWNWSRDAVTAYV